MKKKNYYTVKLNNTYMTDYDYHSGYCDFDAVVPEEAYLFPTQDEAMKALVDVIWGGTDEPPEIIKVEVDAGAMVFNPQRTPMNLLENVGRKNK